MATSYLDQESALKLDVALFNDYMFSVDQLMEIAGLCVAQAVARCYPPNAYGMGKSRVLICCGPGNNGGDGLVAARHLFFLGYDVSIFYPKRTSQRIYEILVAQCAKLGIRFLDDLPSASHISTHYSVAVDAVFGFSFQGEVRPPFDTLISTLTAITIPLCSVDIPSGWDVEKGDTTGNGLRPDLLVSLTAPKECARHFTGRYHYLGLRMVPPDLAATFNLELPSYPDADLIVQIN
eukprot:Em0010g924a